MYNKESNVNQRTGEVFMAEKKKMSRAQAMKLLGRLYDAPRGIVNEKFILKEMGKEGKEMERPTKKKK